MKKLMIAVAVLYGAYWYVDKNFDFGDILVYAKKNPQASWAPAADYYVGLAYYARSETGKAQEAFNQLLTDYSTGPYTARGLLYHSYSAQHNKNYGVARQSLERFLEEFPDHKDRKLAEQRLEFIKFK